METTDKTIVESPDTSPEIASKQDRYKTLIAQTEASRWPPGISGNPAGKQPNVASITYQIKKLLAAGEGIDAKKLAKMAIKEAEEGSFPHFKEILERTDGKVADKTDHTFDGEGLGDLLLRLRGYEKPKEIE